MSTEGELAKVEPQRTRAAARRRARLFAAHSVLGWTFGTLWLAIAWSGSLAVFRDELDWLATPGLRVAPLDASALLDGARLERAARAVEAAHPGLRVARVDAPAGERYAIAVEARARDGAPSEFFVDPRDGALRGGRDAAAYFGSLANFVRQAHVRLLLGVWGRALVGALGLALAGATLLGLWLTRRRLASLAPRASRSLTGRARLAALHKALGLWTILWVLGLASSGALLGLEVVPPLVSRWATPPPRPPATLPPPSPRAITVDEAARRALLALPGYRLSSVVLPRPGAARPSYVVVLGPASVTLRRDGSFVRLDPSDGRVLERSDAAHGALASRVYEALEPLHFAYWGGAFGELASLLVKIVWSALGLTPGVLALTGASLRSRRGQRRRGRALTAQRARLGAAALGLAASALASVALLYVRRPDLAALGWASVLEQALVKPAALATAALPLTAALLVGLERASRRPSSDRARSFAAMLAGALAGAYALGLCALLRVL